MFDANLNFGTCVVSAVSSDAASTGVEIDGTFRGKAQYLLFRAPAVHVVSGVGTLTFVAQVSADNSTWFDRSISADSVVSLTTANIAVEPKYVPITTDNKYVRGVVRSTGAGTPVGTFSVDFALSKV